MPELSLSSLGIFLIIGLWAGIVSGSLGLGSGIILVPALMFVGALPQKSAQGTALAIMVPMVLVGAIRYGLDSETNVDYGLVALLAIGAVVGSLIGSGIAFRLPVPMLRKAFAVFMCVVAVKMFFSKGKRTPTPPAPAIETEGNSDGQG